MRAYEFSAELRAWFKEAGDWMLDGDRRQYEGGKKEALIRTIALCSLFQMELPTWARDAIVKAYFGTRPASWDEVFGRPFPKGKSITAHGRRKRIAMAAINRVRQLNASGESIGPDLFEKVGKELGASAGTISNIYYDKKTTDEFDRHIGWLKIERTMFDELGPNPDDDAIAIWMRQNKRRWADNLKIRTKK